MKKIKLFLLLLFISAVHAAEPSFKPNVVEKAQNWHPIRANEAVIAGVPKWTFTIGYDRLIYVIKNEGDESVRIPEQQVIIYNRYGIALARYDIDNITVLPDGVRSDKDYEKFFPLDIIFKHSEIKLPSDWGQAVWLEMLPVEEG